MIYTKDGRPYMLENSESSENVTYTCQLMLPNTDSTNHRIKRDVTEILYDTRM